MNKELAKNWREEAGRQGGVVVIFGGNVSGWMDKLRDPQNWEPGCIAVDDMGNEWIAGGGDSDGGAERWYSLNSTVDVKIIYNLKKDTFEVSGNAKDPKAIVSEFLRAQTGAGADHNPPNKLDEYTILINLDLAEDYFSVCHDCGNKGLREGILMRFLKD